MLTLSLYSLPTDDGVSLASAGSPNIAEVSRHVTDADDHMFLGQLSRMEQQTRTDPATPSATSFCAFIHLHDLSP